MAQLGLGVAPRFLQKVRAFAEILTNKLGLLPRRGGARKSPIPKEGDLQPADPNRPRDRTTEDPSLSIGATSTLTSRPLEPIFLNFGIFVLYTLEITLNLNFEHDFKKIAPLGIEPDTSDCH